MDYSKYRENEKNSRRDNVLLTAAQLLLVNGIENVKMTDVADACDMGVASLYRYFGTKTNMLILVGELLWLDVQKLFGQGLSDKLYSDKSGGEQLRELFSFFPSMLTQHSGFLKFIRDFDATMLREKVPQEELRDYESTLLSFFPFFEAAYRKGVEDGSVCVVADFEIFYFTATHSLFLMAQKFVSDGILKSDTEISAFYEMELMVNILMNYLQNA